MASSPLLTGFFLDELTFPWGTTLAEAAARLAGRPQWPPYAGAPNLHPMCAQVLGLAATDCTLGAPSYARPVLQASYELAAPPGYSGQPAEAQRWQVPLTARLGPPTQAEVVERPGTEGSSVVVYAARWQGPQVRLSLSVYGSTRHTASGPVAAGLLLTWEDELAAAQPYAVAAAREAAQLAAVAGPAGEATIFQLARDQVPYTHFKSDQPRPLPDEQRRALRALYREHLLETPPYLQQRLAAAQAAWLAGTQPGSLGRFHPLGYFCAARCRAAGHRAADGAAGPRPGLRATRHRYAAPHRCLGGTRTAGLGRRASPPARRGSQPPGRLRRLVTK